MYRRYYDETKHTWAHVIVCRYDDETPVEIFTYNDEQIANIRIIGSDIAIYEHYANNNSNQAESISVHVVQYEHTYDETKKCGVHSFLSAANSFTESDDKIGKLIILSEPFYTVRNPYYGMTDEIYKNLAFEADLDERHPND